MTNPKTAAKNARIKVKFLNAKGKNKGKTMVDLPLIPGASQVVITIPAPLTTTVRSNAAVQAKAILLIGGEVRACETVPVDYDLAAEASASPVTGAAPLTVTFSGSASGGTPPFAFAWDFDDGASATDESPSHTYPNPGPTTGPSASPTP